jgi:hypothetical protein
MSGYQLRSRLTKRKTTNEDHTNPPPSSVSSVASRIHTSFGRGGLGPDPSKAARGGGGDTSRATSRRERGVNITRFSRMSQRDEGKEKDDVSEDIPNPENEPDEDDAVPKDDDIKKIPLETEFDVFQTFRLLFAQSQPE